MIKIKFTPNPKYVPAALPLAPLLQADTVTIDMKK